MMHIMFKTLFCEKIHLCLNLPIKPHLFFANPIKPHIEPRPTKGGIDLCQVEKVYLYPSSKILTSLILNPLGKLLIPLVVLKPYVCFPSKNLTLVFFSSFSKQP
jgi:hypothetical protein